MHLLPPFLVVFYVDVLLIVTHFNQKAYNSETERK